MSPPRPAWRAGLAAACLAAAIGCANGRDNHLHRHPVRGEDATPDLAPGISLTPLEAGVHHRPPAIRSPDGGFVAMLGAGARGEDVVIVRDERERRTFMVSGLPFERPVTDVAWDSRGRLVFDQWPQPHHAVHFEVDVRTRRLAIAYVFPDSFFLATQRRPPATR